MKPRKWVLVTLAVVLVLAAACGGVYTVQKQYVQIGDRYVLRSSEALDLREVPLTAEAYCELVAKMPSAISVGIFPLAISFLTAMCVPSPCRN